MIQIDLERRCRWSGEMQWIQGEAFGLSVGDAGRASPREGCLSDYRVMCDGTVISLGVNVIEVIRARS